jgi:hypothetical protein
VLCEEEVRRYLLDGFGHPDRLVGPSDEVGDRVDENQEPDSLRPSGGEEDRHRPAFCVAEDHGVLGLGRIDHPKDVVHRAIGGEPSRGV